MKNSFSKSIAKPSVDRFFVITLRVLIVVALIQLGAAALLLAPSFVCTLIGHLASKATSHETALISNNSAVQVVTDGEARLQPETAPPLQRPILSHEAPSSMLVNNPTSKTALLSTGAETGLQPGATLGIIDVQHSHGNNGEQTLKIAIKSRAHESISVPDVKVQVYFYDQQGDEIVASKSPVTSQWLNPPVDWKNAEPELLEVTYQPDSTNSDIYYAGYIVAIYYKGELQGYKADPVKLTNQFPIKVFIGHNEI